MDAVQLLHEKRVLHLDIKPSNIVFQEDTTQPIIIDFGLSIRIPNFFNGEDKVFAVESMDNAHKARGTGVFTPPELSDDTKEKAFYKRSDVYSLGVTIFELFIDEKALNDLKKEYAKGTGVASFDLTIKVSKFIQNFTLSKYAPPDREILLQLIKWMTKSKVCDRCTIAEALNHHYFKLGTDSDEMIIEERKEKRKEKRKLGDKGPIPKNKKSRILEPDR